MVYFNGGCSRVLIQNITLQNPPKMHIVFKGADDNITIRGITINTTAAGAKNTDGIDLVGSNCLVTNCTINAGDDNIALGSSSSSAVSANILIISNRFGVGHGVSIGSNTAGGVSNLTVIACTFDGTDYGIRMKSNDATSGGSGEGGVAQNLTYRDITMTNIVHGAIVIYSYYDSSAGGIYGTPDPVTAFVASTQKVDVTTIPIWRNITINSVTASVASGGIAGIVWGRMEVPVTNLTLSNVIISAPKPFSIYNARGVQLIDSQIIVPTTTNAMNLFNAQVTVTNSVANTNLVTLGGLAKPATNNPMAFFNGQAAISDTNMLGTGSITLGNSTLTFSQGSVNSSNTPFSVVAASTLVFTRGTNIFSGALSGAGPLTVALTNSSIMLTLQGNCSGFTGTLVITNNGALRFDQGTNTWGGANVAFDAGASGTIDNRSTSNSVTVYLGALTGGPGSKLRGSDQTGPGGDTYVIGGLNSNTTFAGTITNGTSTTTPHTVALVKIGTGTFTLSGTNTYSGGTTVSNGTLLVNNTAGSGTGTGAVSVVSGATLGGSGIIGGPVTVNGTLAPGTSPGTLTISNNLVVNSGAVLQYQLGTNSDRTVVSGNLILAGTLNVTDAGGFTNTTYALFTYGGTLTTNGSQTILTIGSTPDATKTYTIDIATTNQVKLIVAESGTPPVAGFTAGPTSGTEPVGVTFTDTSSGSPNITLFWDFGNGTSSTTGGASFVHTYAAGTYTVTLTASNAFGTSTLVSNNLISVITTFQAWQLSHFGCTDCPQAAALADPDGDGQNNLAEFRAGTDPNNAGSYLHILSVARQGNDMAITWETVGGLTNILQATLGDANGNYTNNFSDIVTNIIAGSGDVTNSSVISGDATNGATRYYRILLLP